MSEFQQLVTRISQRPGMFVGAASITAVSHYLTGYSHALDAHALEDGGSLNGWRNWVELRFDICHPAWHWTRILLHAFGSDAAALAALPELYAEFEAQRQKIGVQNILAEWENKFGGIKGITEPISTATSPTM